MAFSALNSDLGFAPPVSGSSVPELVAQSQYLAQGSAPGNSSFQRAELSTQIFGQSDSPACGSKSSPSGANPL